MKVQAKKYIEMGVYMKKKVAIIIPSLEGGGAERVIVNIVKYLNKDKFDLKLIVIKKTGAYVHLIPNDVNIVDLDCDRVRKSTFKLLNELNNFKPDVILSTLEHLNIILLLMKPFLKGKPKIIIREANTPSRNMSSLSALKKKIYAKMYKILYSRATCIVAQCAEMKADIIETLSLDKDKIVYIYNPVDLEEIESLKIKFNPFEKENINIVAIGRLAYQKGFDNLIDAFELVSKQITNAHLIILGDGPLKNDLKKRVIDQKLIGKVEFLNFQENPYPYLFFSDMYVLSSRWEGFPNTMLEALACETKVVSTDCKSGPKEILGENEYGFLVKENSPELLADAIITYLLEKSKTQKRADFFDVRKIVKEYESLFLKI